MGRLKNNIPAIINGAVSCASFLFGVLRQPLHFKSKFGSGRILFCCYSAPWSSVKDTESKGMGAFHFRREEMDYTHHYVSPLGGITLASDGECLIGLWFDGQKYFADALDARYCEKSLPVFEQADRWLDIYFSGREPDFTPPLRMRATAFRRTVWEALLTIPYGHTMTYGELAGRIAGRMGVPRMSAQAVGGAVGRNAISLIIPCHRVVGSDGSLTGYAGGIQKKVQLLKLEKADMSGFFVPRRGTAL